MAKDHAADEEEEEEGVQVVNREGFPLSSHLWNGMWKRAEHAHPDKKKITKIRNSEIVQNLPVAVPPTLKTSHSVTDKLCLIQKYISELQYDYTGLQFFEIKKGRPLVRLMDVAKSIIRESLPIKCLEAVILALYLTSDMSAIQRFPLSFKTCFEGNSYKHIVLGIYCNGKFGALGLSRRDTLMYKELKYESLYELLREFINCYHSCYHTVDRIKLGLPVNHDNQSMEVIMWKYMYMRPGKLSEKEFRQQCDTYSRQLRGSNAHHLKYAALRAKETIKDNNAGSRVAITDMSDSDANSVKYQKVTKRGSR